MDFTIDTFIDLLTRIESTGYSFSTFDFFLKENPVKSVILRHDVDSKPNNSLKFARIQYQKGISGVYYFRAVSSSWNERIIREIHEMGHEVGYHYECLTTCQGNLDLAIKDFAKNLTALRRLVPVSTICMHGSPMSRFDSRDMWKTYSYMDFGILGEPYFDLDFNKIAYFTDTGRRWDGNNVSVRDKVDTIYKFPLKSTFDIISALGRNELPKQIMFTLHPQRWSSNPLYWTQELVFQRFKNAVKQHFFVN